MHQKLSEDFIERHADEVCWDYISEYQKLSEDFIERHASEVNWDYISEYQDLSKAFLKKHIGEMMDTDYAESSTIAGNDNKGNICREDVLRE